MHGKYLPAAFLFLVLVVPSAFSQDAANEWTVADIFGSNKFAMKSLSAIQWVDGRRYSYLDTDTVTRRRGLYTYRVADGRRDLVMDGALLVPSPGAEPMRIGSYQSRVGG